MRFLTLVVVSFFSSALLFAYETPLPLGASDLAPDSRLVEFKQAVDVLDLKAAFEAEALEQLDLDYAVEIPDDLELLKRENAQLKIRVSELERRLTAVEAKLAE
ncbi:hypothetical protein SH580_16225 [Coraliomargarita algicola]|uniref:Uncharacterized protein n=1 Tax=Coraliomargarita algicola TaxID=3092156 RepID=A0ABZ0RFW3_9BACT|nr:hypothetical protein [Coraliomargarita sp. J2-16]WPJ94976.1 hypothetical protein SH580_16225 [Coraliomargarita sp. J2-16]